MIQRVAVLGASLYDINKAVKALRRQKAGDSLRDDSQGFTSINPPPPTRLRFDFL
jgi:hypothetical protein